MHSTASLVKTYSQLTQEQRYQISAMKKIDSSQKEIAAEIGVNKSTISRELRRNAGERGYRPKQAHEKALGRRSKAQVQIGAAVWEIVEAKLRQDWSPEQVSGWLKRADQPSLSHEWIYQHILADKAAGGDLYCTRAQMHSTMLRFCPTRFGGLKPCLSS